MCGINGFNWNDHLLIQNMNNAIAHRGPDGEGIFENKDITFGHRRLSIIDLSEKGSQPMHYQHKGIKVSITFNGEIFNFQDIKNKLIKKGYTFTSKSDTEVILAAYLAWGKNCVKQFNGQWSFCIYDPEKKILFCSRDRLGQKPFYYFAKGDKFIFSSELKGILEHKNIANEQKKQLNTKAIEFYFSMGFIPAPMTVYNDIKKLEARTNLTYNLNTHKITTTKYYSPSKHKPSNNKQQLIREGRALFNDAIRLRLISDRPVGAFLSGGVDSSTVVSLMSEHLDLKHLNTFSVGFEGKWDESKYIKITSNAFHTKHHHKYFKKKDFENLKSTYAWMYDEPFGDFSGYPTWFVSKMAKEKVTVALSGDGGDEVFGGYYKHQLAHKIRVIQKILPKIILKGMHSTITTFKSKSDFSTIGKLKEGVYLSTQNDEDFEHSIYQNLRIITPNIQKWYVDNFKSLLKKYSFVDAVVAFDHLYLTLPDQFLTKVDRASMAHGLEVRSPFLDYRFIEFSAKIPSKWKVNGKESKILLKEMVKDLIPKNIISRAKQGFTPPLEKWILDKNTIKKLKEALTFFKNKKIISQPISIVYENIVFKDNNALTRTYLIRLHIFLEWYNYWIKPQAK